jgi:nucleotide-binding universal stress UspA family protein
MLNVRKILVPVDFSECSGAAVDYAAFLAESFGAQITLLHAWQPPADLGPFLGQVAIRDPDSGKDRTLAEFVESQSRRALDGLLERVKAKGVDVEGRLEAGAARKGIIDVSESEGFDLIVMGTHGRTGLAHAVMGSVAEWVVRHAKVPVLTVRADEAAGEVLPVGEQAPAAG